MDGLTHLIVLEFVRELIRLGLLNSVFCGE